MKFGSRPCTIVQGLLPDFGATLKIREKSNFVRNQFKLSTQHKYMYNVSGKIIKNGIHLLPFFMKFGQRPSTIVQGLWPNF